MARTSKPPELGLRVFTRKYCCTRCGDEWEAREPNEEQLLLRCNGIERELVTVKPIKWKRKGTVNAERTI